MTRCSSTSSLRAAGCRTCTLSPARAAPKYLLKYLCKGAGSTMTAADEKYDDDVEMLDVT